MTSMETALASHQIRLDSRTILSSLTYNLLKKCSETFVSMLRKGSTMINWKMNLEWTSKLTTSWLKTRTRSKAIAEVCEKWWHPRFRSTSASFMSTTKSRFPVLSSQCHMVIHLRMWSAKITGSAPMLPKEKSLKAYDLTMNTTLLDWNSRTR